MRAVIRFFASRPTFAYVFLVMMIVPGLLSLSGIQRDNFPNVDFNEMIITTRYPGASPEDVERHVTNKIEEALKKVDDLDRALVPLLDRPIEELDPIEHTLLRMGMYELGSRIDVPFKVVINEAVALAKKFGATDSHKYVNGVLDKAARELRKPEVEAAS